jgi:hypothetical protein
MLTVNRTAGRNKTESRKKVEDDEEDCAICSHHVAKCTVEARRRGPG